MRKGLYHIVKYYNQLFRSKRITTTMSGGSPEFEKEIVKVLRKFNIVCGKKEGSNGLQKVKIICEVEKYPIIKLQYLTVD